MTAPYKKRAKAGWNRDKKQSNRDERAYEAVEVAEQALEETKHKSKVKVLSSEEKAIKAKIRSIRWAVKLSRGNGIESLNRHGDNWMDSLYQEYYQKAKKAIPELEKLLSDDRLSNKLRREIEEILSKV